MAAGFLLCIGLVSCEMKDEIFGNDAVPTETGLVELGVAVDDKTNVVITKADATGGKDEVGSSVDPSDFPVIFTLKTNENYKKEFTYSEIAGKTVELPIGTYEVVSHTPGEMEREMSFPYYKGNVELTVGSKIAQTQITCTMQNSRILMDYPATFKNEFSEWTITIDDGTEDNILTFVYNTENPNLNPAAVYWAISENCPALTISIKAITKTGAAVSDSRTITKPDGAADKNWVGGDALTITMEPIEDNTGNVSGISIKVDSFFETVKGDVIEAPLGDEDTETPTDPDGGNEEGETGDTTGEPTITMLKKSYSLPTDMSANANVTIKTPAGLKSIEVNIIGGNEVFETAAKSMFGEGAFELIGNTKLEGVFEGMHISLPKPDCKEYIFPIQNFFSLLADEAFGPTTTMEGHVFEITVKDNNDTTIKDKVNIIVTGTVVGE